MSTTTRNTEDLHQHQRNSEIYSANEGTAWTSFVESVRKQGILTPIVITEDGTIVSGFRRWCAAKEIGLVQVPVETRLYESDDELLIALVEYNRYRIKTLSETMREALLIEEIESRRARLRHGMRTDLMDPDIRANLPEGRSRDAVASVIGVSRRTYDKMRTIYDHASTNSKVATMVERLDRGETSVDAVYNHIRSAEIRSVTGFNPKVYDYWTFGSPDTRYGNTHPGQIHPGIVENLLHLYTNEGDLVVDPFAGGGITIDICKAWNRRCYASDIDPRRPDIEKVDILSGYPEACRDAQLVFLDPPYWNMVAEDYSADGASSYSLADFVDFLRSVAHSTMQVVRLGGFAAFIIMKSQYRLPDGVPILDWPFIWYRMFLEANGTPIQRIYNMWPTSIWQPFHVTKAKEEGRLLPVMGDICVFQRRNP